MNRSKRLSPADEQLLRMTLVGFRCFSYADIAAVTGWPLSRVAGSLVAHRKAAARDPQGVGWTVAPLPKGQRRAPDGTLEGYHFVVVDAQTGLALSEADRQSLIRGGVQALGGVEAHVTNFVAAIRLTATQLGGAERAQLTDIADILVGAGKMATGAHQRLAAQFSS
jgi:hypothetical protein